jgi:hypothetical protein
VTGDEAWGYLLANSIPEFLGGLGVLAVKLLDAAAQPPELGNQCEDDSRCAVLARVLPADVLAKSRPAGRMGELRARLYRLQPE